MAWFFKQGLGSRGLRTCGRMCPWIFGPAATTEALPLQRRTQSREMSLPVALVRPQPYLYTAAQNKALLAYRELKSRLVSCLSLGLDSN